MHDIPLILKLDITGNPTNWINYMEAVRLYATDHVVTSLGTEQFAVRGGVNALTGQQSVIEIGSILLTRGLSKVHNYEQQYIPHLTNKALFRRDDHVCLYCGEQFHYTFLTRDHVIPISRGGADNWENVVTACFRCNNHKGSKTLAEWGLHQLIAVPFVPNKAEYLFLQNRRIIADQQAFLASRFRKNSTLSHLLN